jgi:hypothetical protein
MIIRNNEIRNNAPVSWQFAKKGQILFGAVAKGNRQLPLSF